MKNLLVNTALVIPIDIERMVNTCRYYSNGKVRFGIYSFGTGFFPKGPQFEEQGRSLLGQAANTQMDFVVKEMDDKNFLVGFGQHVFGIVFKDEIEANMESIERDIQNQNAEEFFIGKPGAPLIHRLVGLVARTRLLKDVEEMHIARTVDALA